MKATITEEFEGSTQGRALAADDGASPNYLTDLVGNRSYTDYQHVTAHFDTFWSVYQKSMDLSALSLLATVISLNQVVLAGHPYTPYLLIN